MRIASGSWSLRETPARYPMSLFVFSPTTPQRSKFLPEVPTIDESGLRGYDYSTWTTLAVPTATPKEAVQKLRAALEAVIAQPKTREAFERFGAEVVPNTAEEFTRRLEEDYARWTRIRKETGLKFD